MGMKCANCGKGVMYGHNVSHSKRRTRKIFKPNLHNARIVLAGQAVRVKLCTKCLRVVKKATATVVAEEVAATSATPAQA